MDNIKKSLIEFLKGFGTILLFVFLSILGNSLLSNFIDNPNKTIAEIAQIGVYLFMFIGLSIPYYKRLIKDFKSFKKSNLKIAFRNWLGGLIIMIISNTIIISIIGNIATNESLNRNILSDYPVSSIISMTILGPILEEITFRLSFKNAFNKWYTFAIFTGIIFGLVHVLPTLTLETTTLKEFLFIIPYGSLGFFFAKAFYETDNIFTSIIMHITHNTLSIIFIFASAFLRI